MDNSPAGWIVRMIAAAVGVATVAHHPARQAPATIEINGQKVFEGDATFVNSRCLFPISFGQGAGVQAYWDSQTGIAVFNKAGQNVAVKADRPFIVSFLSDGNGWLKEQSSLGLDFDPLVVRIETPPLKQNDELLVPIRVIAGALNADYRTDVVWVKETRTVSVTVPEWNQNSRAADPQSWSAPRFLLDTFSRAEQAQQ